MILKKNNIFSSHPNLMAHIPSPFQKHKTTISFHGAARKICQCFIVNFSYRARPSPLTLSLSKFVFHPRICLQWTTTPDTPRSVESNPIWEDNNSAKTRPTPLYPIPIQKANLRNVTSSHKGCLLFTSPSLITYPYYIPRSVYVSKLTHSYYIYIRMYFCVIITGYMSSVSVFYAVGSYNN